MNSSSYSSPDKRKAAQVWGASPAGTTLGGGNKPGTKEFFEEVLNKRKTDELPFLAELIPYPSFRNKKVLEIGCGAGYDAFELCRNSAHYFGIDITPENPERTRKHLGFYGYFPIVMVGDAENLPFKAESFEILFSVGVLHHTPDIKKAFIEAFRVLKGGGEFWAVVYHKNSIFYCIHLFLFEHIFKLGFLKRSLKERLSMIEFTTSNVNPLVNVYSRTSLRKLLAQAGFTIESLHVRKLKAEEFPPIPLIWKMWRFIPQQWLDVIGKAFGWYIIAKVKKYNYKISCHKKNDSI